jgi:hypothetical protein
MTAKFIQDLFQLSIIFGVLTLSLVILIAAMFYLNRNAQSIKKWWRAKVKIFRETNWIGVFLILGLILVFMCHGPIIIF